MIRSSGEIDASTVDLLVRAIEPHLDLSHGTIIVDLSEVTFLGTADMLRGRPGDAESGHRACSPWWPDPAGASGFEDDLLAVVLLVLEHLEAAFRLVQREGVGDDPGGIDLPVLMRSSSGFM